MKRLRLVLCMLAAGLLLTSAITFAGARVVDCDRGDSLQKAIESGTGSAAPLEIRLLGTCNETFQFTRDRITISGDGNTTIVGNIRIFTSDQVQIEDLTVTGPGPGITVFNGRARFLRVNVVANEDAGVVARQGAAISIVDSHISDNHGAVGIMLETSNLLMNNSEVIGNWGHGIAASQNSSVSVGNNSTIHANQGEGIQAKLSSAVNVANSHVWGNGTLGISISSGSAGTVRDSAINANQQGGIDVWGNSTLDIFGGMTGWNADHGVWVTEHSFLRLVDAQVYYNLGPGLVIGKGGGVVAEGDSGIEDNTDPNFQVVCHGSKASIEINPPAHVGPMDCTDNDF